MDLILPWIVIFLSVFAAFVPMVVYLFVIWWMDRYYRQPVWLVGSVFLWGALGRNNHWSNWLAIFFLSYLMRFWRNDFQARSGP